MVKEIIPAERVSSNEPAARLLEVSIVIPCLNEEGTVGICVQKAINGLIQANVEGEVIVADNGSTDGSREAAKQAGARVINVFERGYGATLRGGFAASQAKYVIMGDADNSYDFSVLTPFVEQLREGHELVMGTRLKGTILPGAMRPLHRYLGNPVLTFLGNLFFGSHVSDFCCGLRGFNRPAMERLQLNTSGMETALEMIVKATVSGLSISEVPITFYPDGRSRPPHLRTWYDGWRHLKFFLLLSPSWLFMWPGLMLILLGVFGVFIVLSSGANPYGLLVSCLAVALGTQILTLAGIASIIAVKSRLLPAKRVSGWLSQSFKLGYGLLTATLLVLLGILLTVFGLESAGAPSAVAGLLLIVLGGQLFSASFVASLLNFNNQFS